MTFLKLFRLFIEYHQSTPVVLDKRHFRTIQAYASKYTHISEWLYSQGLNRISPAEFKASVAKRYFSEMCAKYSHNHAVRLIGICKSVVDYGVSNELIRGSPISSIRFQKIGPQAPVNLDQAELESVWNYAPPNSTLFKAREMILYQCYSGMDYGDEITVERANIKEVVKENKPRKFIIKNRLKSNKVAYIPYTGRLAEVFERNNCNMYMLSNAGYNKALKDLAIDCMIDKRLTSHVGRKTFGHHKLNFEGYSLEAVSKMMGHSSINTTEKYYVQIHIDLIARELTRLGL